MKNAWKAVINKSKERSLPPVPKGWFTRSQVAVRIGCSEDRVNDTLKLAMKDRSVLTARFEVWDKISEKVIKQQFYRINKPSKSGVFPEKPVKSSGGFPQGTRVKRRDTGNQGTVIASGKIKWDSGVVTTPSPRTFEKIAAV